MIVVFWPALMVPFPMTILPMAPLFALTVLLGVFCAYQLITVLAVTMVIIYSMGLVYQVVPMAPICMDPARHARVSQQEE